MHVIFDELELEKGCSPSLPESIPEVSFVRNPNPQITWDDMSDSEIEKVRVRKSRVLNFKKKVERGFK